MASHREEIIRSLGVQSHIDPEHEARRRIEFLKEYAKHSGANGYVLGVSGGQDSALAAKLCQIAVSELRANGHDAQFIAVRLPYGVQRDEADAQKALEFIDADEVVTVNVQHSVDALVAQLEAATGEGVSDFNKGNVKARMRMVVQYALAGDRKMLVVGTDHAAEAVTGFFTKFGDGAADVVPLAGLTKGQGIELLRVLKADESLWLKTPTADLLDADPGQSDESSLGVSYLEIDAYLQGELVSDAVSRNLEQRYLTTEHKRRPPVDPDAEWWH